MWLWHIEFASPGMLGRLFCPPLKKILNAALGGGGGGGQVHRGGGRPLQVPPPPEINHEERECVDMNSLHDYSHFSKFH